MPWGWGGRHAFHGNATEPGQLEAASSVYLDEVMHVGTDFICTKSKNSRNSSSLSEDGRVMHLGGSGVSRDTRGPLRCCQYRVLPCENPQGCMLGTHVCFSYVTPSTRLTWKRGGGWRAFWDTPTKSTDWHLSLRKPSPGEPRPPACPLQECQSHEG